MTADIREAAGVGGLRTYVLTDGQGGRAEVVPSRGGLVTRFGVGGSEVLFLDPATLADSTKNVRGGIPVLFPQAGKLPTGRYEAKGRSFELAQHGFARQRAFEVTSAACDETSARLECRLDADEATLALFPYAFRLTLAVTVFDGRLMHELVVENRDETPMPLHLGLHPYFQVAPGTKAQVQVETAASRAYDQLRGAHVERPRIDFGGEMDLHLLDHPTAGTFLTRPGMAPVRLSWTEGYRCLVLWTQPDKPFVCVEPWSAPAGALATGEGLAHVSAGEQARFAFELALGAGDAVPPF